MPEIKNTFMKSKMNQDLDERLLPNGEYREGVNIAVNKSESDDVGAMENILGNHLLTNFGITTRNLDIIGSQVDESTNSLYAFATNYTDSSFNTLSNRATSGSECFVLYYNFDTDSFLILVAGSFLNFSKTHPVQGVTILENLLFWTDNRNQPRKINITKALEQSFTSGSPYYYREEQISVAKYFPWDPIKLWKENSSGEIESTMRDVTSKTLPYYVQIEITDNQFSASGWIKGICTKPDASNGDEVDAATNIAQYVGVESVAGNERILCEGVGIGILEDTNSWGETILKVNVINGEIYLSDEVPNLNIGDTLTIGLNPYYDSEFPGDENFLKDKFIKLAYRFKFDDNEYSIASPFTQSIFVPKNDGYIQNRQEDNFDGEKQIYDSTIASFFENKITQVKLQIPTAADVDKFSDLYDIYHVQEIDILYKSSDSLNLMVLDTIKTQEIINATTTDTYEYVYNSRKPIRTLPESYLVRVSDVTPIRALTQDTAGNRILYANYTAKTAVPDNFDYSVSVTPKLKEGVTGIVTKPYYRKEYQNHSLKQNRTYQVGIVLSDRYGRQSDVILSQNDLSKTNKFGNLGQFGGSTTFSYYRSEGQDLFSYNGIEPEDVWPGDSLKVKFNNVIPSALNTVGYAGLYADEGGVLQFEVLSQGANWLPNNTYQVEAYDTEGVGTGLTLQVAVDANGDTNVSSANIIKAGKNYGIGEFVLFEEPTGSGVPDIEVEVKVLKDANPLGWYTYKIVVKQQQQDYYNVYLPGILNNLPQDKDSTQDAPSTTQTQPAGGFWSTPFGFTYSKIKAYTPLYGDNINKVPRDLQEVGPEQSLFNSSVSMWPRVVNYLVDDAFAPNGGNNIFNGDALVKWRNKNIQITPEKTADKVVRIGKSKDVGTDRSINGFEFGATGDYRISPFYSIAGDLSNQIEFDNDNSALIASISTQKQIGTAVGYLDQSNQLDPRSSSYAFNFPEQWPLPNYKVGVLSVYETAPTVSNIPIFYETNTTGLISELNDFILDEDPAQDNDLPTDLESLNFFLDESMGDGDIVTGDFYPLTAGGLVINNGSTSITLTLATNGNGGNVTSVFSTTLIKNANNSFKMAIAPNQYFVWYASSPTVDNYTFTFEVVNGNVTNSIVVQPPNLLNNISPYAYYPVGSQTPMPVPPPTFNPSNPVPVNPVNRLNLNLKPRVRSNGPTDPNPCQPQPNSNTYSPLVVLDGFNGSADPSTNSPEPNRRQLRWEIEEAWVESGSGYIKLDGSNATNNWNSPFGDPWFKIGNSPQQGTQTFSNTIFYNRSVRPGNPNGFGLDNVFQSGNFVTPNNWYACSDPGGTCNWDVVAFGSIPNVIDCGGNNPIYKKSNEPLGYMLLVKLSDGALVGQTPAGISIYRYIQFEVNCFTGDTSDEICPTYT